MIMPILFRKKSSEVERLTGRQVGRWVYSSANLCSLQCLKQVGDKETTIWSWGGGGGGGGKYGRDRLFFFITGSARKFISG